MLRLAGFDARPIDGDFGDGTAGAVRSFQSSNELAATGEADERTQARVGMDEPDPTKESTPVIDRVTIDVVRKMFSPATPKANIERFLPAVLDALAATNLDDLDIV